MKLPPPSKYPKSMVINEEDWRIQFVKVIEKDPTICGMAYPERIIKIKKGMSRSETMSTFIHELIHACEFEGDFDIPHKLVYRLEKLIVDLLMVNF